MSVIETFYFLRRVSASFSCPGHTDVSPIVQTCLTPQCDHIHIFTRLSSLGASLIRTSGTRVQGGISRFFCPQIFCSAKSNCLEFPLVKVYFNAGGIAYNCVFGQVSSSFVFCVSIFVSCLSRILL